MKLKTSTLPLVVLWKSAGAEHPFAVMVYNSESCVCGTIIGFFPLWVFRQTLSQFLYFILHNKQQAECRLTLIGQLLEYFVCLLAMLLALMPRVFTGSVVTSSLASTPLHLTVCGMLIVNLFVITWIFSICFISAYNKWVKGSAPSLQTSPLEAIVVGVLAVCGVSLFAMPLLMMLLHMYSSNAGVSLIPTATTSVNTGRRKRNAATGDSSTSYLLNPKLLSQVADSFQTFLQSEEKMQLLQSLIS